MNYVFIGEIVNTHGLKGELKIVSDFKYKKEVFKKGQVVYLGNRKQKMIINSYRPHKIFDMVTFESIDSIDVAIAFKTDLVYVDRASLDIDGYVDEDIIGLDAYDEDNLIGKVTNIMKSPKNDILVIKNKEKKHLVPFIDEFISSVNLENKRIQIKVIEGLLNEI